MENKQTIEEAVESAWATYKYEEGNLYRTTFKGGFKAGAKWQAEMISKIIQEKWIHYRTISNKEDSWSFKYWLIKELNKQ